MIRRQFGAVLSLALVLAGAFALPSASRGASNVTSQAFSVTAVGPGPIIPLNGFSTCGLNLDNIGSGMSLTVQATNDANPTNSSQWSTVTTLGTSGVISTAGIFTGNVAGVGLTGFRFLVTALTSGVVSGSVACSTATAKSGGGAGTVTSVTASLPNISSGGNTPNISFLAPGTSGNVLTSTGTGWASQASSGGLTPYDATVLANASLTHYWPMNDAFGATAAADAKGAVNLAQNGTVIFGTRVITRDGETAIYFDNSASDFLTFPNTPLIPATGPYTVEMVVSQTIIQSSDVFFSADNAKSIDLLFDSNNTNGNNLIVNNAGSTLLSSSTIKAFLGTVYLIDFVCTATTHAQVYINAVVMTDQAQACGRQAAAGKVGGFAFASDPFGGYIAKLAIYNDAETTAQIRARLVNM